MTTTFTGLGESSALPDPGGKNELINQGEYEMFARTGDLAIIALAERLADHVMERFS